MSDRTPPPGTILQVNAYAEGGAGRVMLDLHREYLRRDLDSWVAMGTVSTPEPRVLQLPNEALRSGWSRALARTAHASSADKTDISRTAKALLVASDPRRYLGILSGVEDFDFPGTRAVLGLPERHPDVLHLHNLHGYYFDLRELPALTRRVPTVLTMHDAWLLTGHCAHPFDCERWKTGCGDCPDLDMYVPIRADASARNWKLKRHLLAQSRVVLVSPSRWLLGMVQQSVPLDDNIRARVIPNGVDVRVFHPGDREGARSALGLPLHATILLAAAAGLTDNPFKDFATLRDSLPRIAEQIPGDVVLVALGAAGAVQPIPGVDVRAVPFADDPHVVATYYQAADVYVHAARAENLPLTVIEAMACGTPVVASDVGGVGELVVGGVTGTLVAPSDSPALADAVVALAADRDRAGALGRAAAQRVLERFTLEAQADAYLALYAEVEAAWHSE